MTLHQDTAFPDTSESTRSDRHARHSQARRSLFDRLRTPVARWMMGRFSRRWRYDVSYMEEMLTTTPEAFFQFMRAGGAANYRRSAPLATWGAVRLVTMRSCDCGPCLQLTVDQLLDGSLAPAQIRAVLDDDVSAMERSTWLGHELATALVERGRLGSASHDLEAASRADRRIESARSALEAAQGRAAAIECALTFALVQSYPLIKRGMGYDKSCSLVEVGVGTESRAVA